MSKIIGNTVGTTMNPSKTAKKIKEDLAEDLAEYVKKTEFDRAVKESLTSARVGNDTWDENDIEDIREFLCVPEVSVDGETGEETLYLGDVQLSGTQITALLEMLKNMGDVESALDIIISEQEAIIEIQNALIGGVSE